MYFFILFNFKSVRNHADEKGIKSID